MLSEATADFLINTFFLRWLSKRCYRLASHPWNYLWLHRVWSKMTTRFQSQMTFAESSIQRLQSVCDFGEVTIFLISLLSSINLFLPDRVAVRIKLTHSKVLWKLINARIYTYMYTYIHFKLNWPFLTVPTSLYCGEDKINGMYICKYLAQGRLRWGEGLGHASERRNAPSRDTASAMMLRKERVCMHEGKQTMDWCGSSIGSEGRSDVCRIWKNKQGTDHIEMVEIWFYSKCSDYLLKLLSKGVEWSHLNF